MSQQGNGLSRRRFLQRAGTLGAALTMPGVLAACGQGDDAAPAPTGTGAGGATATGAATGGSPAAQGEPIRVGLMLPLSGTYAPLGEDMQEGFQLFLDQNGGALGGRPAEVVVAESEANPETGLRAARRLIEEEQVAIVSGIVSSAVAYGVKDVFAEAGVPLIVSNAGANELNEDPTVPVIFRTSFTNYQPNFALGQWAAENMADMSFVCIAPDYAAGQEHIAGFVAGFGGDVVSEIYPPFGTTTDYQPFLSEIRQSGAAACMAFFAGGEAVSFVTQYANFGLKESLPLIGPGFLTDDGILEAQGDAAVGIRTALHYSPLLDNPRNQEFTAAYEEAYGAIATTYVMQSYDAAQLIDLALQNLEGDVTDSEALVSALENAGAIDSPRGQVELTADTHDPVQNIYLREVQEVEGGIGNVVIEDLGSVQPTA